MSSSDNEIEIIYCKDDQEDESSDNIENNLEPETILIEIDNHNETDEVDDEKSDESIEPDVIGENVDEYTTKCAEIYINTRSKSFHLYCYYCRREYINFGVLSEHITEIHFPFNYKRSSSSFILALELCGEIFISDLCRFIHICMSCKKPFQEYKKLLHHYLSDHTSAPPTDISYAQLNCNKILQYQLMPVDLIPKKKRKCVKQNNTLFKCKYCKREFLTENERKSHACERPWPCTVCGKSFKTNWNLIEHTRVHTGEKPFHCDKCEKSFTKSGNLNVHRLTHTETIPIKCDFCWSVFSQKSTLKSHIRRLHPNADHELQITKKR